MMGGSLLLITVMILGGVFAGASINSMYNYAFVSASDDSANPDQSEGDSPDQSEDANSESIDRSENTDGDVASGEESGFADSGDNQSNTELQTQFN